MLEGFKSFISPALEKRVGSTPPLEMWAGLECTVNRVEDRFVNQCEKNRHVTRIEDLQKFAQLGVKRIRYPALWELVAPEKEDHYDWSWVDERFNEMKRLGLKPIAGLIHHGSGPKYTNLLDVDFPLKFAKYAKAFATRFPWVDEYTPINEILTTGFFSCLYGHWYPHKKNDRDAVTAVMNQVKAVILAMKEIRKINPNAKLIQTEDIGRCQSTPKLQYQANFQNQRRWLSFDALCGKIDKNHPIADWLMRSGMTENDMEWLKENACPPDILGINHYLLSDRFLDHRLKLHPKWSHGGNGIHSYADVGAIDTDDVETPTPGSILEEAWQRFQIPLAVTEAHICGHREIQMQWLNQIWTEAQELRQKGVDIRAVTAWSLLGTYDWNNLCTVDAGFYESGVFDLRTGDEHPRETAIGRMVRHFARNENFDHPVLDQLGWWRKQKNPDARPLLITGGRGTLARAFARICESRGIRFVVVDRSQLDIADHDSVSKTLSAINPWAVINTAGYVKVDEAENDNYKCYRENVVGPANLAAWCHVKHVPLVTFSTDLVFNGEHSSPYHEGHEVSPLNTYGLSKAESERRVLAIHPASLVIRTSSFFGPWDEYNFVTQTLRQLHKKTQVPVSKDIMVSPTYVPDLVNTTLDLLIDGEHGLVHLVNDGSVSWAQFAKLALQNTKQKRSEMESLLVETTADNLNHLAKRPKNSALTSQRFKILPSLENALERYYSQLEVNYQT